ncbi:MAG: alginate O-acetyltransferase AlgX-related protein [Vulcanococcus sp.]
MHRSKIHLDAIKTALIATSIAAAATASLGNLYAHFKLKQLRQDAYRPTDRYSIGKRYEPNVNVVETTTFGDLCALSGAQTRAQCPFSEGARTAHFQTDQRGWKTLEKLERSDLVIAGDSFLAALGGDANKDQLGQQLRALTGLRFYEAAHPGDPGDYLLRLDELDQEHPRGRAYLLLLFEGNDLAIKEKSLPASINQHPSVEQPWLATWRHALDRLIFALKNPPLAKLLAIYTESYRLQKNRTTHTAVDSSLTVSLKGKPTAFGTNNTLVSQDRALSLPASLSPNNLGYLRSKIKCIIFVPTKYSIYLDHETTANRHPGLAKDFSELNKAGIATVDLTTALRARAQALNPQQLWWRDDTHWNKFGIQAAAEAIANDPHCLRPIPNLSSRLTPSR